VVFIKRFMPRIVATLHSDLDDNAIRCACCGKKIADVIEENLIHDFVTLYKGGNVPIPNFGWLCSQSCALKYEQEMGVRFDRNSKGMVDYYEHSIE
jgi:hypothetical protein